MSGKTDDTVRTLLERHGRTYCDELGIEIAKGTPAVLFRWLVASMLFSARISAGNAVEAAHALTEAGLGTAEKMAGASWQDRVDVLTAHGYKRFDESYSRMLGETAEAVRDDYGGDLRKLRELAGRDVGEERKRLKAFKGLGDVGVDIFFREVQTAWPELYPFADAKALRAAEMLGLPKTAKGLAGRVSEGEFPRLVAALVRTDLAKDYAAIG
jgi:endonuclease III